MLVQIDYRPFGGKRFRPLEHVEAEVAEERVKTMRRLSIMCDFRISPIKPKRRRARKEYF